MLKNIFLSLFLCTSVTNIPLTVLAQPLPEQGIATLAGQGVELPFSLNFSPNGYRSSYVFVSAGKQLSQYEALSHSTCQVLLHERIKDSMVLSPRIVRIEKVKFWTRTINDYKSIEGLYSIKLIDPVVSEIICLKKQLFGLVLEEREATVGNLSELLNISGLSLRFVEQKPM